jgi:catechol 2,3-dioxygenase-like lactoylglutathione lyase family enzyme
MIFGAHVIVYSKDPAADRAFFRDVLGFSSSAPMGSKGTYTLTYEG